MKLAFILKGPAPKIGCRAGETDPTRKSRVKTMPVREGETVDEDLRLADIPLREVVELVEFDLPEHQVEPLLERGVLPGCKMCPVRRSPFGDPVVMIDGTLIALRKELAGCLCVRRAEAGIASA